MTVPKLRFPEFRDAGEWIKVAFGKLGFDVSDGNYSSKYPSQSDFVKNGVPFLRANNLRYGSVSDEDMRFISKQQHSEITKGHLKKGDILLSTRGDIGIVALVPDRHIGSNINAQLVRINTGDKSNNIFIFYSLNYSRENGIFQSLSTGTALKQLPIGKLNNLELKLPELLDEQQKIADCLSSIGDRITAETQKLDTLKAHKKGLMQQLFPAEGETLPKLRFSQFRDVGEWINTSLGKVSKITSGGTPSRSNKDFWKGNIPWVTTSLIDFNTIFNTNEYISEVGLKGSSAKLFPKNTILMAMYGQGKTRGKVAILGIEATTNQACAAILLNKELDINFVFQNLASRYDEIRELSNRGGQENLSAGLIEAIYFSYPIDKSEQQKIANCLSSLDELITAQTQKIDTIKTHKKGLMQQLFPALDEVVG